MSSVTTQEFIDKVLEKFPENSLKYDYSKVEYVGNEHKVIITCKKCGDFQQVPRSHLQGSGCPICAGHLTGNFCRGNTSSWIEKVIERHPENRDKFDYSTSEYVKANIKVDILCRTCSKVFSQTPNDHYSGKGCPHCCGRITTTESFITKVIDRFPENSLLFDYSRVEYINDTTPVSILCKTCNSVFQQAPTKHYQGHGCNLHAGKAGGFRRDREGYLYITKWCYEDKEFIKVGISSVNPKNRTRVQASSTSATFIETLYSYKAEGGFIMDLERWVLSEFKDISRHVEKDIFPDGYTETFPLSSFEDIQTYIKEIVIE
jgi:Zn finger protein HypA/HybF involved in hydrogenase expression